MSTIHDTADLDQDQARRLARALVRSHPVDVLEAFIAHCDLVESNDSETAAVMLSAAFRAVGRIGEVDWRRGE